MGRRALIAVVFVGLLVWPHPAAAQRATRGLHADRLQTTLELLPDGSLQVTESITFRFTDRTFSEVERRIPHRFTDGLIDVEARLDGHRLPDGDHDGQARISNRLRDVRVIWHFPKTTDTTHVFTLNYRAMGVVRIETGRAAVAWHVLPSRHRYVISEAMVTWILPPGVTSLAGPAMEAEGWSWQQDARGAWVARKTDVAVDETAILTDDLAPAGLSISTPAWQIREERARQLAPAFIVGALVVLVMGAGIVAMMFVRYQRPRVDRATALPAEASALPPALGTALRSMHPRVGLAQMSATLFDLLARGVLAVQETSPAGTAEKSRTFDLALRRDDPAAQRVRPHELVVLDALWLHMKNGRMPFKDVQRRLFAVHRAFYRAAHTELRAAGLLDADREWASNSVTTAGLVAVAMAVIGVGVCATVLSGFGDAALLVPGSVGVLGAALLIVGQSFPTVSTEGAAQSARWAARARMLRTAAKAGLSDRDAEAWFPYAIGLGLGRQYAKSGAAVRWLQNVPDPAGALTAIVAAGGGAHAGGGAGVSGGGMAGGGGFSGAR